MPAKPRSAPAGKAAVAVSAAGIAACVACCTLPLALPAAALASAASLLAWLERSQAWMPPLAVATVLLAWLWIGWQSAKACAAPARSTLLTMSLATALVLPVLAWPWIEPAFLRLLKA